MITRPDVRLFRLCKFFDRRLLRQSIHPRIFIISSSPSSSKSSSNFNEEIPQWKRVPPRFVRYLNRLSDRPSSTSTIENLYYYRGHGDGGGDETATFLVHCPYLALRWNLVTTFVRIIDRWLADLIRPRILNSISTADTLPYVLHSMVRVHRRWTYLRASSIDHYSDRSSGSTNIDRSATDLSIDQSSDASIVGNQSLDSSGVDRSRGASLVISRSANIDRSISTSIDSDGFRSIDQRQFAQLLDRMVAIGFHQCYPADIAKSCQALSYFSSIDDQRSSSKSIDNRPIIDQSIDSSSSSSIYSNLRPSELWLDELMNWICRHLRGESENRGDPHRFDSSIGSSILNFLCRFDTLLPSARYELVLRTLAGLIKADLRDFVAVSRSSSKFIGDRRSSKSINGRYCRLIPSPRTFVDFSSSWLAWNVDPDHFEMAPGSWRVWYESIHYSATYYRSIGYRQSKPSNSYVIENSREFAHLLVDMIAVAGVFGKESIFVTSGARATWERWASLIGAFEFRPAMAAWLLVEIDRIEEVYVRERKIHAILPSDFSRPELRRHLTYLASRSDMEEVGGGEGGVKKIE